MSTFKSCDLRPEYYDIYLVVLMRMSNRGYQSWLGGGGGGGGVKVLETKPWMFWNIQFHNQYATLPLFGLNCSSPLAHGPLNLKSYIHLVESHLINIETSNILKRSFISYKGFDSYWTYWNDQTPVVFKSLVHPWSLGVSRWSLFAFFFFKNIFISCKIGFPF